MGIEERPCAREEDARALRHQVRAADSVDDGCDGSYWSMLKILVTGAAGFIGYPHGEDLLERGDEVVGLDNLNDYYDVALKHARLAILAKYPDFRFVKLDLADRRGMTDSSRARSSSASSTSPRRPACATRSRIRSPTSTATSSARSNVLEGCRHNGVEHLVYASTSSVYGANTQMPFSVHQNVDHPLSFYAATKKATS